MSATSINISIDSEIGNQAQDIFAAMGLDMSAAINIFLKQTVKQHTISFDSKDKHGTILRSLLESIDDPTFVEPAEIEYESPQKPLKLGCMKGRIWMADDFDEPMEEFAEYM